MSAAVVTVLSSMATRLVLGALAERYEQAHGLEIRIESLGGVDALRRVQEGEDFDLVVLAGDAMDKLARAGRVLGDSRRTLVHSSVEIAVREGAPRPDISTQAALRAAVLAAATIGYSTGPSGTALLNLFERWGLSDTLRPRLVQAPPGVPVGGLVAAGEAELGFQQYSELMHVKGITLIGGMPPGLEIVTPFVGAVGAGSAHAAAVNLLLDFLCAADTAELKRRHGFFMPAGQDGP